MVSPGDMAPDIDSKTSTGEDFRLSDLRGQKNVVLFFYPGDFTPLCTKEACGFQDIYAELRSHDTEVIGISDDSHESHQKFAKAYSLGFPLLSDPDHQLAKRYGATNLLTAVLGRVSRTTFVIDKSGRVAAVIKSQLSAGAHLAGVKDALARLK
jgi:thioredoxin-dependent peroxiredoxin